jgi:hypothetical protein
MICLVVYYFGQENMVCYYVCINPVYGNKMRDAVTIYVPIVLTKDGRIHEVMRNLKIYNASKVEIINTKYGKALKIVTSNYTVIKGYYAYRTKLFSELDLIKPSLSYDYNHVYIYLNGKADYVDLSLSMCSDSNLYILYGSYGWFLGSIYKSTTLEDGWNGYYISKVFSNLPFCEYFSESDYCKVTKERTFKGSSYDSSADHVKKIN